MEPLICTEENASRFHSWITSRRGIAVWKSRDLSNPTKSWSTPLIDDSGKPFPRPHWSCDEKPDLIYTDAQQVLVSRDEPVKRFSVHIMQKGNAQWVCAKKSSEKIKEEVRQAGELSFYEFDYETQECIVYKSVGTQSLSAWAAKNLPQLS